MRLLLQLQGKDPRGLRLWADDALALYVLLAEMIYNMQLNRHVLLSSTSMAVVMVFM